MRVGIFSRASVAPVLTDTTILGAYSYPIQEFDVLRGSSGCGIF